MNTKFPLGCEEVEGFFLVCVSKQHLDFMKPTYFFPTSFKVLYNHILEQGAEATAFKTVQF